MIAAIGLFIQQINISLSSLPIACGIAAFGVLAAIVMFLTFNLTYFCRARHPDCNRDVEDNIGLFDGLAQLIDNKLPASNLAHKDTQETKQSLTKKKEERKASTLQKDLDP